jgi:hypothetical protein
VQYRKIGNEGPSKELRRLSESWRSCMVPFFAGAGDESLAAGLFARARPDRGALPVGDAQRCTLTFLS